MSFQTISLRPTSTIPANRIVGLNSANTVGYCTASTQMPLGISLDTVLDTTASLPIQLNGIGRLYFNDSVTAGALIGCNSNGCGIPYVATTNTTYSIGILLGASVDKTGTIAEILINPCARQAP